MSSLTRQHFGFKWSDSTFNHIHSTYDDDVEHGVFDEVLVHGGHVALHRLLVQPVQALEDDADHASAVAADRGAEKLKLFDAAAAAAVGGGGGRPVNVGDVSGTACV